MNLRPISIYFEARLSAFFWLTLGFLTRLSARAGEPVGIAAVAIPAVAIPAVGMPAVGMLAPRLIITVMVDPQAAAPPVDSPSPSSLSWP
ncbi:MAG: hypothetical protein ABI600_14465 [Luteolibacter sp.]